MARYEFRSRIVEYREHHWLNGKRVDHIEQACNEWAEEGFIVFSVIVPQGSNYNTFRLTAKRDKEDPVTPAMEFKE